MRANMFRLQTPDGKRNFLVSLSLKTGSFEPADWTDQAYDQKNIFSSHPSDSRDKTSEALHVFQTFPGVELRPAWKNMPRFRIWRHRFDIGRASCRERV